MLWDKLKEYKEGRIIILTTHFMDEADYLGDRIAIMGDGRIKTCGTSMFLKKRFGVGYTLDIFTEGKDESNNNKIS
jgi:ABC-type multidrug transport system ATPase subunit